MPFPSEYGFLPALVFAFLVVDLLIEVGSIQALVGNIFFWIYWLIYTVAAETALYLLESATQPSVARLPKPVLLLIAIAGTTTILQSLTFKIGGKRVFDLSRYLDDYRRKVLSSSAALVTRHGRVRVLTQSRSILEKVNYVAGGPASEERMKRIYAEVMLSGARTGEMVHKEISNIEWDCRATGATFGSEVARRVALADPEWVKNFLTRG